MLEDHIARNVPPDRGGVWAIPTPYHFWTSYGFLGADWAIRTALTWEERQDQSDLVQQHMTLWDQVGSGPDQIRTFEPFGIKVLGKRKSRLVDNFQQAVFGNVDMLTMPWCLIEDSSSVYQAAKSIRV